MSAVGEVATYWLLLEILAETPGHDIDLGVVDVRVDVTVERTVAGTEVLGAV